MMHFKRILAIGAHPDDVEFGCLGLLLKQPRSTATHIYVASLGSKGDPSTGTARRDESLSALEILGPQSVTVREAAGLAAADFDDVLQQLTGLINDVQPDLILTLGPQDTHQEHRRIYEITLAAARRSKASILNYAILSNTLDFKPSLFVDVSDVITKKKEALARHRSQRDKYYMTPEYFEIFHSHNYASLHGIRYSESYEVVRLFN